MPFVFIAWIMCGHRRVTFQMGDRLGKQYLFEPESTTGIVDM
jgi:hypothetical protein